MFLNYFSFSNVTIRLPFNCVDKFLTLVLVSSKSILVFPNSFLVPINSDLKQTQIKQIIEKKTCYSI